MKQDLIINFQTFASVIKQARKAAGYKSVNAALRAGLPVSEICVRYAEDGKHYPNLFSLLTMLEFYGQKLYMKGKNDMDISYSLDSGAYVPEKAHGSDAAFDLRTPIDFAVSRTAPAEIDTGVHLFIPEGWCGLIVSKSGLNFNKDLTCTGLVDAGYTGSICVKLCQHTNRAHGEISKEHIFSRGDKIAQIMILPVPAVNLVEGKAPKSERGAGGFGSSGR